MKKIFLSFSLVLLLSLFVVNHSSSYLSDTEGSSPNSLSAGSIILNLIPGYLSTTGPMIVSGLQPGESSSKFVVLQNGGTTGISRVGLSTANIDGSPSLYDKLGVRIYSVSWPGGWPNFVRGTNLLDIDLKDLSDSTIWTTLAPAGGITGVREIEVFLPADADGSFQGLTTTWQFNFMGYQ